jgi:hypothetical protein
VLAWVLVAVIAIGGRYLPDDYSTVRLIGFAFILVPSVFIAIFCSIKIHVTSFRQMKSIAVQQAAVQRTDLNTVKNFRRVFTLGIVVMIYGTLYISLFVVRIISSRRGNGWIGDQFRYQAIHVWITCLHIQSFINPLIYSLRLSDIRKEVFKKISSLKIYR